jgi:signal transduction histidine kinase
MPPQTSVTAGRYVCLSVRDTGTGISAEALTRIFDPYFTTKDPGRGTGLGLAIVKHIVEAHGGTVTVRSELGRGSRFDVRLPLVATFTAHAPTHVRGAQPDRSLTPV